MASYPKTIEQITIPKHGDIDVIEKTTQPFPTVKPGDVVVKIEYLGINFIDTYHRKGLYPLQSFPAGIGKEAAGTIVGLPTDPEVLNHPSYKERGYKLGSNVALDQLGAHATYASVPWKEVWPLPDSVTTRIAAAATLQTLTAVTFAEEAYKIRKGDTILIHTVAGGLGLLLAQLARSIGAKVIGTTSTEEKAKLAKEHGADWVILYKQEDTVKRVLEITNGEGVDAVFDGVGKDTFLSNFDMLKRKGTLVTLGNASGPVDPVAPAKLTAKNLKLLRPTSGNYLVTPEESTYYSKKAFELIENGTLKINIHKEYPFTTEGVRQAQTDLTTGQTIGKLIVKVI